MRLETASFSEIEDAKKRGVPLIIPVGTIEYHGPHCPLGCDTQIAAGIADEIAKRREALLAPPVWYGVAGYAVAGPEKNTVSIDVDVFENYIACIAESLLRGGFRNIILLIHHQYEQESLMPMTLACMKAAKKVTMAYLEETRGIAWWGDNASAEYYDRLDSGDNPFNWIRVLPCMSTRAQNATGYDHAGKWECSLLSVFVPDSLHPERIPESDEWFIQSASEASREIGLRMTELSVEDLLARIG